MIHRPVLVALALAALGCGTAETRTPPPPLDPLPGYFGSPLATRFGGDFGMDVLFGAWGDANVVALGGRRLAVCLRARRHIDPNTAQARLRNQVGVYDITQELEVDGYRFDLDNYSPQVTRLNHCSFTLQLEWRGSDVSLRLTDPQGRGPTFGVPGQSRLPTLNELFRMRGMLAKASSSSATIEGATYRVTAESATTGNLLLWSEQTLRWTEPGSGDPRWIQPDLYAEVNVMEANGTRRIADAVPFGRQFNGRWWGLRWNAEKATWEPAAGEQFRPGAAASGSLRIAVPSVRQGAQHRVKLTLVGRGGSRVPVELLVDTGASLVSLPESLAARLGFGPADFQPVTMQTANGAVTARATSLDAVEISGSGGSDTLMGVPVVFLPDAALGTPLLGMSVLGRYRMTLEDARNELLLERAP